MEATVRAVPNTGEYALFIPNDSAATKLLIEKLATINMCNRIFYLAGPVFEQLREGPMIGVAIFQLPTLIPVQESVYQEFADYINQHTITECPPPVDGGLVGIPETGKDLTDNHLNHF